jgi:lipoprotein-releasing system permease protein
MSFELFIAMRYLMARRKQAFISVISLISTGGVAVGVMALVIALALMTGLQGELRDRILASTAHVYVWKAGGFPDYGAEVARLKQIEGVLGAAPTIQGKALITTGSARAFISIKGIDPALEPDVTEVQKTMQTGGVDQLVPQTDDDVPGILLGRVLAEQLGVKVGDSVSLLTDQGTQIPGGIIPRNRPARVAGIYSLGLLEFDSMWGFVSLDFARRLIGPDEPEMIQLRVADVYEAPVVAEQIVTRMGTDYVAQDWQDLNQELFAALWIEKVAVSLAVALIVVVAALQIIASLVLLVMEKSRDIAILKTMGASSPRVMRIFMAMGVLIGVVGTTIGGALGLIICFVADHYRLIRISMEVYQIAYVPFVVVPRDFVIVIVGAIVICFLATIYPSRQASKLDPVQALRFE